MSIQPSTRLQVSHGSLHSITAICLMGRPCMSWRSFPSGQLGWVRCGCHYASKPVIPEEGLIHDYFFLFLEPTEERGNGWI